MDHKTQYRTRQGREVAAYLQARPGQHVTAAELCAYFARQGQPMGKATVYRRLERLVEAGLVTKYTVDATACCQQGLEFVWEGDLPEEGTELLVTGRYEAYDFGGLPSYHLVAESVEVPS